MLEQSQTVFWYVLSGSIGVLTLFLCWGIYYLVRMLRNAVYVVEKFTSVLQKADEVLDLAKEKLHSGGTYLAMAIEGVKTVAEFVGEKKAPKKRSSRKKK